tara:strand:- start:272 stop:850 length:579 start_codon:yes stop_codon:yes gene_type:complete
MLNNYYIAFIIIIVVTGVIFYIHLKNDSEQSPFSSLNLVDAVFGTNKTSSQENQSASENQTSTENQSASQNQTSLEDIASEKASDIFKNFKNEMNSKMPQKLPSEDDKKKKDNKSSFATKHKYFIDSLDNSINYCKNNSKFKYIDYLEKYKTTYIKLHTYIINRGDDSDSKYNSLVKKYISILDNLNQKILN